MCWTCVEKVYIGKNVDKPSFLIQEIFNIFIVKLLGKIVLQGHIYLELD